MFIRSKRVKGFDYGYAVENKWTKKGPRQKKAKYLGRIYYIDQEKDIEFEEYFKVDIDKLEPLDLIKEIIGFELYKHGFQKVRGVWRKDDFSINLTKSKVMKDKSNIVLGLNNDFLCGFTLKRILKFKSDKDKQGVAMDLAKAFVQAGIPIDQYVFISLFQKIYRPGQSFVQKLVKKDKKVRVKKIIVVTGTPGAGKTTLSKELSKRFKYDYIDVNDVIKDKSLEEGYDKKKDCKIIDTEKLAVELIKMIKVSESSLVIDSHMSHYLPKRYVNLCLVTRCNLKDLKVRLEDRGYSDNKVRENLDSEIFEVCLQDAIESDHNVLEVQTDEDIDFKRIKKAIEKA